MQRHTVFTLAAVVAALVLGDCATPPSHEGLVDEPPQQRSADRFWDAPAYRFSVTGFRVARNLSP